MRKNRRLGGLFKCLQEKLPVLRTLARRRKNIYRDSNCISCKNGKEEDQDHLSECSKYKDLWNNLEETAIQAAWTAVPADMRHSKVKDQLRKAFWGSTQKERISTRKGLVKGLIREETFTKVLLLLKGKVKEATCFCDCASVVAWNIFYEEIWRIRCEDMIKWEKSNGICRRDKFENKRKKNPKDPRKDQLKKELLSEKEKKKLRQEIKEKELAEKCRREKLLEEFIEKLIAKGEKPFWYGL
ncbi:hypothetical protein C2G38_2039475 [Gigaspora rosea]|uniref:Reverse transcriptase zinc-binding domain-containing protein n=1 Tax=Gigaspora rosea TaxID=44941 RepID=A0A397V019_9GLOM|nr:hypothetical protein C2G38_2039475 [Gigaspora rosea]